MSLTEIDRVGGTHLMGPQTSVAGEEPHREVSRASSTSSSSTTPSPAKSEGAANDDLLDDKESNGSRKRIPKGRVFQCTGYPDCSMSFTRSEHLARHKRKHTGERPFTCPHCSKNFSRLDNLRQHKQTVHAYEIFSVHEQKENQNHQQLGQQGQHSLQHQHQHQHQYSSHQPAHHQSQVHQHQSIHQHHIPPPPAPIPIGSQMTSHHIMVPSSRLVLPEKSSNPETPNTTVFSSGSNIPSSSSSVGSNHQYSGTANSPISYYSTYMHHPLNSSSSATSSNGIIKPLSDIRSRNKRRPRPLSLSHSFYGPSPQPSATSSSTLLSSQYIVPPLKSAPLIASNKTIIYGPKSASLTPNMISPLSPLFHHSFSQTIQSPYQMNSFSIPTSAGGNSNGSSGNNSTTTLPPVTGSHFSIPSAIQLTPVQVNKRKNSFTSTNPSGLGLGMSSGSGSGSGHGSVSSNSSITPPLVAPIESSNSGKTEYGNGTSKQWLRGVLNEEPAPSKLSAPVQLESKKPTINSLLSPY
ncbi:hypothetical protein CLIB1423_11S02674 [[Candida] railenensis]|uniref:C2H2-type domain-containing protein n=1 Tax=[Candida] railenensis TaxID=45579 RepID=A0A9P0QRE5_9ASCO|nr:hypothetical protein CLIB1423_11S02674 [[Candida] railenensis]